MPFKNENKPICQVGMKLEIFVSATLLIGETDDGKKVVLLFKA